MEKKLYVVSFGDSKKYLMDYNVPADADQLHKPNPFEKIENELTSWLAKEAPEASNLAYFTSAKATEVYADHRDRYAGYPQLDASAVREIEHELLREVRDSMTTREANLNAPWSDVATQ